MTTPPTTTPPAKEKGRFAIARHGKAQPSTEHKPLEEVIRKGGFIYEQVKRYEGKRPMAIYSVSKIRDGKTHLHGYEAIVIMRHNGISIRGVVYPPAEYYPCSEHCGRYLWYYGPETGDEVCLARAINKVKEIQNRDE